MQGSHRKNSLCFSFTLTSQYFWHQMCGFSTNIKQFCNTNWVSYSSVQFLHHPSVVSIRSHKLRAQSHKTAPTLDANHQSQVVTCTFDWPAINWGSQKFARTAHRNQGNTHLHLLVSYVTKDMIKDIDEQPDEDIHRVRSERVLSLRASVPRELGCTTLPAHRCVHQPTSPHPKAP